MLDQGWPLNLDRAGPIWSWFDAERYARHDSLAFQAARAGGKVALDDYRRRGEALGYAPNLFFDPNFYLTTYPDVATLIRTEEFATAFDHYGRIGWRDRDPHWLFRASSYASYQDLQPEVVEDLGGLYGHFLRTGAREGRLAHELFDPAWYAARQPPKAAEYPFEHFLAALEGSAIAGSPEPQCSPFFDPVWYLATYPDAARAVAAGQFRGALHHYLKVGVREGRDPLCDFSEADYLAANPDVAKAVQAGAFRNGYDHFLQFGALQVRSPCSHVDLAWYAAQPAVARDLASARFRNAFGHLLGVGVPAGWPLVPPPPLDFALDEADARAAFAAQARRNLATFGRSPLDFRYDGVPEVSVIVVLRNQFALTMQSLASLRGTFAGPIQLLIVDNASSDGTTTIGEVVLGAKIIRLEENVGFLRACNLALRSATAAAVLYMNNDVVLHAGAVRLGLDRLGADASVGAVGGKIIRTHGLLQEAGCLLWRDAAAAGWMRDAPPDAPEANYVRTVDYCSGCFLLVRGDLLRSLGGFDEDYAPAYYEETDLCLRIAAAGYRVLYDPAITLTHYEYGSSRSLRAATALMLANRSRLQRRHVAALRVRPNDRARIAEAANFASRGKRVLFIEDTVPLPRLGSGYGRAFDLIQAMDRAGWQVTVFPMHGLRAERHQITAAFSPTVEVMWDRDHRSLQQLLSERHSYYDLVWISRAHNLVQFQDATARSFVGLENAGLVLDTEAVFSLRDKARTELDGTPFDLRRALAAEFKEAWQCDHVVAVNQAEADVLRSGALASGGVVGCQQRVAPTARRWDRRRGLLHVGALTEPRAPNVDGLRWFLGHVLPLLQDIAGRDATRLTVVGAVYDGMDVAWLRQNEAVDFMGPVADLSAYYDAARVLIAPTRFAAGVATKVLDATSHGVPVVATSLIAEQLDWTDGVELLAAPSSDPAGFADRVARLIQDEAEWDHIREAALAAVGQQYSPDLFAEQLAAAMAQAVRTGRA